MSCSYYFVSPVLDFDVRFTFCRLIDPSTFYIILLLEHVVILDSGVTGDSDYGFGFGVVWLYRFHLPTEYHHVLP